MLPVETWGAAIGDLVCCHWRPGMLPLETWCAAVGYLACCCFRTNILPVRTWCADGRTNFLEHDPLKKKIAAGVI